MTLKANKKSVWQIGKDKQREQTEQQQQNPFANTSCSPAAALETDRLASKRAACRKKEEQQKESVSVK